MIKTRTGHLLMSCSFVSYRGLIEIIPLNDDVCILCNEEAKLIGLEPNRRLWSDVLCGVFYVTGQDDDGNLCSLSESNLIFSSKQQQ